MKKQASQPRNVNVEAQQPVIRKHQYGCAASCLQLGCGTAAFFVVILVFAVLLDALVAYTETGSFVIFRFARSSQNPSLDGFELVGNIRSATSAFSNLTMYESTSEATDSDQNTDVSVRPDVSSTVKSHDATIHQEQVTENRQKYEMLDHVARKEGVADEPVTPDVTNATAPKKSTPGKGVITTEYVPTEVGSLDLPQNMKNIVLDHIETERGVVNEPITFNVTNATAANERASEKGVVPTVYVPIEVDSLDLSQKSNAQHGATETADASLPNITVPEENTSESDSINVTASPAEGTTTSSTSEPNTTQTVDIRDRPNYLNPTVT